MCKREGGRGRGDRTTILDSGSVSRAQELAVDTGVCTA